MNRMLTLILTLLTGAGIAHAATVPFTFQARTKVIQGNRVHYEVRPYTYYFRVEVLSDQEGLKSESRQDGKPYIEAVPEERYSVRIYNPLPVRAGVNLTVDGLSRISGKPVGPDKGKKWIIQPNSFVTIRGWQVSGDDARRFFFTSKEDSYASWHSNAWGRDLSVNCGVIGAAYFWSKDDMEGWLEAHPVYEPVYRDEVSMNEASREKAAAPGAAKQQAGTGMGEQESHPVRNVEFHYDTGMYRAKQAVVIYYDFAPEPPRPRPFTDDYAPEMPMR